MADAGFFRGTSSDQDGRFSDKEKKLLKQMKFEDTLERKINMDKINLDVIKPWITMRINEILGIEDDVVIEYIMSQLEEKNINPKIMQINITGFLNARRAREFMGELWMLLIEADESEDGIPRSLIEKKINEMRKEPRPAGNGEAKIEHTPQSDDWAKRYSSLSGGRYTGPTKEKEISDDRITRISPRGGTPPRQRRKSGSREGTPPRRKTQEDRDKEREKEREQRRQQRIEDEKKREEESKRREEERLKRRAEEREREKRKEEERARDRERERRRAEEERRERERRRRRSRSRSRSPAKRRFTEGTSSSSKRRRSPSSSDSEDNSRKKRKKKHSRRSSDDDSDYERKTRKEKKSKKHKKEKKKKERKRSPTPSSSSLSDTE